MGDGSRGCRRVVLSGFMGAGKSTVGRMAAQLLGWSFQDVDQVLVERVGMSIAQLFHLQGEVAFRRQEADLVRQLLQRERAVIALGGGALECAQTRELLSADSETLVVFLDTPLHVSVRRCLAEPGAAERPVLRDAVALEQRFWAREDLYRATAGLTLSTDGETPAALARCVADAVGDLSGTRLD